MLARVITARETVIMAKQAKVKSSVIDGKLDMINQCASGEDTGAFSKGERQTSQKIGLTYQMIWPFISFFGHLAVS